MRDCRFGNFPFLTLLGIIAVSLAACKPKGDVKMIEPGSTVKMHYTLTVDDKVMDKSKDQPLTFVAGKGKMIPGVDKAVIGMKIGEKKQITVTPEEGYGPRRPEAVQKAPKTMFQDSDKMKVGSMVQGDTPQGRIQAVVTEVGAEHFTLDLNHPLAGKTLNFDIEIADIQPPAAS